MSAFRPKSTSCSSGIRQSWNTQYPDTSRSRIKSPKETKLHPHVGPDPALGLRSRADGRDFKVPSWRIAGSPLWALPLWTLPRSLPELSVANVSFLASASLPEADGPNEARPPNTIPRRPSLAFEECGIIKLVEARQREMWCEAGTNRLVRKRGEGTNGCGGARFPGRPGVCLTEKPCTGRGGGHGWRIAGTGWNDDVPLFTLECK